MKSDPELNKENTKAFAYAIFRGDINLFSPFSGVAWTKRIIKIELVRVFINQDVNKYKH